MAEVLIIGAGVMGSAIAVPAADNGHRVKLVGTHKDAAIIAALKTDRRAHPKLNAPLPDAIEPYALDELTPALAADADLIIVGVSSPGVDWIVAQMARVLPGGQTVALVTKGLEAGPSGLRCFTETVAEGLAAAGRPASAIIGVGGPCIAKELADRQPTTVVYACSDATALARAISIMQTDTYRISPSDDVVGVEVCAALKNFYAIAVSAMWTRHQEVNPQETKPRAMNPVAALFTQAVREMAELSAWLGGRRETAHDLAGMGDLHVTVGGGRNSRLGFLLGDGMKLKAALDGPLAGETVEGVDTGLVLAPALDAAFAAGTLERASFPVACALIDTLRTGVPLAIDFAAVPPACAA